MSDNYLIPVFISGTILLVLFAFFIIVYLIIQKQKQNTYELEKSKIIYDHQNKMLVVRIEEQERTMDQISKEIHDNIGQLLNFIKMNMYAISKHATDANQVTVIEKVSKLIDHLIKDVHNISHILNSDYIKIHGIIYVLKEELDYIKFSKELTCHLEITGTHTTFLPDKELLIYRIAQEAIHNVTKHAQATELKVSLCYLPNSFIMTIADNGIGFDKSKIYELNGIGFLNMFYRTKLLNGNLDIQAVQPHGASIILEVKNTSDILFDPDNAEAAMENALT